MYRVLSVFLLASLNNAAICQSYPEASDMGKSDLMTGMDLEELIQYFPFKIHPTNNYSEKDFMLLKTENNWVKKSYKANWKYSEVFETPNMIRVGETLFIDQTEIANINYQVFIALVKADSSEGRHLKYLPTKDTEYYLNPEFYFYPIIGINREQATAYCLWRSRIMNYYAAIIDGIKFEPGTPLADSLVYHGGKTFLIGRLPSIQEWREQAKSITMENIELKVSKKNIKYFKNDRPQEFQLNKDQLTKGGTINFFNVNIQNHEEFEMKIPSYIYSFHPSSKGFYNLIGNVAEITNEGFIVGGDFQSEINSVYEHDPKESTNTGFRCVCEVYKTK